MKREDKGTLIAFEGIDGAGKTTQVELLAAFLDSIGEPFIRSKEPTDGVWGQKIRRSAAEGRMSLDEELHAFIEDRKQHLEQKILPALAAGQVVILDRYFYSTIAYQGSRGGDVDAIAARMRELAPTPDAVVLLDAAPEIGLTRIFEGRGETPNAFEHIDNLRAVRRAFLHLAQHDLAITVIDGTPSLKHVQGKIMSLLLEGALKARYCAKPYGCDGFICGYRFNNECQWVKVLHAAHPIIARSA